jgi:hypothetical protein
MLIAFNLKECIINAWRMSATLILFSGNRVVVVKAGCAVSLWGK